MIDQYHAVFLLNQCNLSICQYMNFEFLEKGKINQWIIEHAWMLTRWNMTWKKSLSIQPSTNNSSKAFGYNMIMNKDREKHKIE
jgi:hypothetical protein